MSFLAQAAQQQDLEAMMAEADELRSRMEVMSRQMDMLAQAESDKLRAKETLEAAKNGKEGDEIMFPVGGNTFVPGRLGDVSKVIKGVGGGYVLPRTLDQAIAEVGTEVEQVRKDAEALGQTLNQYEARYQQLAGVLQQQGAMPPSG